MAVTAEQLRRDTDQDIATIIRLRDLFNQLRDAIGGADRDLVRQHLLEIAQAAKAITWKIKDPRYVRNMFGKINYPANRQNQSYVDFVLLSQIEILFSSEYAQNAVIDQLLQ